MRKFLNLFNLCLIFLGMSLIPMTSCKHDPPGLGELPSVCFDTQILPIFETNCAMSGCHNGSRKGSFNTYAGIMKDITAGNPRSSQAYSRITSTWSPMPPKGPPLSEEQRSLIYVWILQGANNTVCDTTVHK